jgi:hypothetical protein
MLTTTSFAELDQSPPLRVLKLRADSLRYLSMVWREGSDLGRTTKDGFCYFWYAQTRASCAYSGANGSISSPDKSLRISES